MEQWNLPTSGLQHTNMRTSTSTCQNENTKAYMSKGIGEGSSLAANARLRRKIILRNKALMQKSSIAHDITHANQVAEKNVLFDSNGFTFDTPIQSLHHSSLSAKSMQKQARLRRMTIMNSKKSQSNRVYTDENSFHPSHVSRHASVFDARPIGQSSNRNPLSPICFVQLSTNIPDGYQGKSNNLLPRERSTQQSCYDLATAQNVTTQTQTSYQVDLYHNSDPREARMRRKLSMIQKASKRRCIVSDENSTPPNMSTHLPMHHESHMGKNLKRIPLSPLYVGLNYSSCGGEYVTPQTESITQIHSFRKTSQSEARLRRKIIMNRKASKRSCDISDENFLHTSGYTHVQRSVESDSVKKSRRFPLSPLTYDEHGQNKIQDTAENNRSTLGMESTPLSSSMTPNSGVVNSTQSNDSHQPGFAYCYREEVDKEPNSESEVFNPDSLMSSKSIAQPLHVLNSIPSMTFNLDDDNEELDNTIDISHQYINDSYLKADSEDAVDFGAPTFVCGSCGALMWYEERADKSINTSSPEFSLCCMKGTIQLPVLRQPPALLNALLNGDDERSRNYWENIRAYNSMFSFTSLGGKVQNSSTDGGGPPQSILSGQNYHRIGTLS